MSAWEEITSFQNLCRAAKRAARGKRAVAGAARFLERLEPEALALEHELAADLWRPSPPTTFTIHDPKERVITAAPFRDRVVHHALVDPLEARFDAALAPETFACRRGKGTHRALAHARGLVQRHSHFLKLDIEKCFDSIEHGVVLDTLRELDLEPEVMRLVERVLGGHEPPGSTGERLGVGLPIGNLTSQWFANVRPRDPPARRESSVNPERWLADAREMLEGRPEDSARGLKKRPAWRSTARSSPSERKPCR